MNISTAEAILRKELTGEHGFIWRLRAGEGFDEDGYQAIVSALDVVKEDWKEKDMVPKAMAALIYWIDKAIEECSYAYPEALGRRMRERAMVVMERIESLFS